MKKLSLFVLFLAVVVIVPGLGAQEVKDLSKIYPTVSVPYSVPDNDKQNFADVDFRFAWNSKPPYNIAIQFVNHGYSARKFKFGIKDVTSKKMIVLDKVHNSNFGNESLKANSKGLIWSGPIDNSKDSFSLHVWNADGDEFDKVPISIADQQ